MNHWARKNTGITNTKGQMIPLFSLTWLDGGQRGWSVVETSPKALTKLSSFQTGKGNLAVLWFVRFHNFTTGVAWNRRLTKFFAQQSFFPSGAYKVECGNRAKEMANLWPNYIELDHKRLLNCALFYNLSAGIKIISELIALNNAAAVKHDKLQVIGHAYLCVGFVSKHPALVIPGLKK